METTFFIKKHVHQKTTFLMQYIDDYIINITIYTYILSKVVPFPSGKVPVNLLFPRNLIMEKEIHASIYITLVGRHGVQ